MEHGVQTSLLRLGRLCRCRGRGLLRHCLWLWVLLPVAADFNDSLYSCLHAKSTPDCQLIRHSSQQEEKFSFSDIAECRVVYVNTHIFLQGCLIVILADLLRLFLGEFLLQGFIDDLRYGLLLLI